MNDFCILIGLISGALLCQVDVDKPLGLQLAQGKNGLKVKSASGNAAKAGIQAGDTGMCRKLHVYMIVLSIDMCES